MSDDISKFKVADLKRELKSRGLSTSGNKQELMDRLQEVLNSTGGTALKTSLSISEVESGDEDEIGDTTENLLPDDLDEEKLLNTPTDIPTSTTSPTNLLKRKSESQVSSSTESLTQPKRISLGQHSKISFGEESSKESTTSSKPSVTPVVESAIDPERKVIKLSGLSVQERLELRAKKFNVPLPSEAKLEARAERFGLTTGSVGSAISVKTNTPSVDAELLKKRAERFGLSATATTTTTSSVPLASSDLEEKKRARAERFGLNATTTISATSTVKPVATSTDDVLARRAQRFRIVI